MTIEASLERIATALESLAAQAPAAPVATAKVVDKPAKSPKAEAPKAEPKKAAEPDPKELVGKAIEKLLKAGKRDKAVALLGTFNGAKSASGVLEQGVDAVSAFLAGAEGILLGA